MSCIKHFQVLAKSLLHLAFPSKCLHCGAILPPDSRVLCEGCASLLEMISPEERCLTCFNSLSAYVSICHDCLHIPSLYTGMGAAFNYDGPPASLIKWLKYANQPHLAKGIAAYLIAQFDRLGWPMPDAFVPVPLSWARLWERGYNQSALIANELGELLKRPVWHALKRKSGDFSQAALSFEQRKTLKENRFKLNCKYNLEGKVLLVIDDVMTTGSTLRCCAEILNKENPASLYAMTFCRTQCD